MSTGRPACGEATTVALDSTYRCEVPIALTLLTPLLAFGGALLGVLLNRRGARELQLRSIREETMRNLRWSAELAIDRDPGRAKLGVIQLATLDEITHLEGYERAMVRAAFDTVAAGESGGEEA